MPQLDDELDEPNELPIQAHVTVYGTDGALPFEGHRMTLDVGIQTPSGRHTGNTVLLSVRGKGDGNTGIDVQITMDLDVMDELIRRLRDRTKNARR